MKKLLLLLLAFAFVCAAATATLATDVVVSATTIPNANFSNIGQDRPLAVTVTSGSPTITSANLFTPYVGKRGYTITINGTRYVVASVADANTLTLTSNYVGLTGSTTATWHKFVEVRFYSSASFRPKGKDYLVPQGTPGTGEFYLRFYASVIVEDAISKLFLPQFTIDATTDATVSTAARYTIVYYRPDGSELDRYRCGAVGQVAVPPGSPTSLADICSFNASAVPVPDNQTYTRDEIDRRVPRCSANQMIYYASSGNAQNCLSLDPGTLQISGGTLSVIGGGGGGGIGGSGTTNSVPYFTNSNTVAASNLIYSTASQLFQFGYSVDIQAGGLSKLTLETDQIIFQGGVSRANNSIMQAMKATASQTGPFQRFTESTGSIRFEVDIDGDVKPRGVNYTWPLTSTSGAMLNTSGTLSWVPFNSSYFSTSGSITPKGLAGAINPKTDHGCVGDDVADDTTCLANAITAAVASGGKRIKLDTGTYRTTAKLTVPGGVTIIGDGEDRSIIHGTGNDVILDLVAGTGASAFKGPVISQIGVRGSSSGASQIGIRADDALYFAHVDVQHVTIANTGSHGLYVGNAFSSTFKEITSGNSLTGYPFLINSANMPINHYEKLYPTDVNTTSPAGIRVRAGEFYCVSCNGINVSGSNSWWAIVGDKIGVDGAVSNRSASITCKHCNIESSRAGGIWLLSSSTPNIENTSFIGEGGSSGTWIALKFEVDSSIFPPYFAKGRIDSSSVFASSPASFYANSEPIHANDLPPIAIEGNLRVADGSKTITSYRNTSNGRSERLYRVDANRPLTTITTDTTHSNPGADNIEANCAVNCTYTLPWPGWFGSEEKPVYIRSIGIGTLTVQVNSGGTINGGASYALAQGESASFMPNSTTLDYRLMGLGGVGVANRVTYWSDTQKLTSSANLTYNGTTFLIQRSGGNPFLAINDISGAGINTRFGPLASAPDRAIIGTTSNHPFGLYANNAERWTVGVAGHFTPFAANSYDVGSASLQSRSGYFGTSLNVGIGSSVTGQVVLSNSSNTNTTTLQSGAPSSSMTITLPATLPASAGCLQISSAGVITQTGSACGGGGGGTPAWSDITAPIAGLSLGMAAYATTFTWNATTGSSVNLFNLTDTASNTGTGYIFTVGTAASSAAKPVRFTAGGTANGVEMTTAGIFQAIGSGGIIATTGDSATAFFSSGQIEAARGGTGIDSSGATGVPRVNAGTWSVNAGISHLASSTSADLRGTLSDETGTGAAVFAGGNIGAATATSLNGLTITNSTGTFTLANGKTFTVNNSIALSGTDATTMTFPASSTTLAGLGIAQTFTQAQTVNPSTTPGDGWIADINALGSDGTRDSHGLTLNGRSRNSGVNHLVQWRIFNDVTSNAGLSQLSFAQQLDSGGYTVRAYIDDSGSIFATGFAGDGSLLSALDASAISQGTLPYARMPLNILNYNAACDGTTNDDTAIASMFAAAVSGDTISFEGCKTIKFNTQVAIGNGSGTYGGTSSATASTVNDLTIEGHGVTVVWGGSSGGPFVVNGPISRVKIRDISVNMGGNAGIAFDLNHPRLSEFANLHIQTMADWAVRIRAYQVWTPGDGANGNTFTGIWGSSTTAGAKGIDVGYTDTCTSCSTHLDVAQNSFRNIRMRFDTGVGTWLASSVGMRLNFTDAGQCEDCIFSAATALSINVPSGSSGTAYPAGYQFDTTSLQGTASFTTTGTWAAIEKIGFTNYLTGDGQTIPVDSNTYGVTSNGIRWGFGADAGYISGLQLEWVSTTQVKIKSGSAQIQSTGEIVTLPTDTTIGPSLGASTWYYCYLYISSGTPSVECVTTAPATAWFGNARSKTSNTARRYIGAIKTNGSSQLYNFFHNPFSGYYQWLEDTTASPFRVGSSLTATSETSIDATAVAPATARQVQLRMINTSTPTGNVFIRASSGGANSLTVRVNSDLITPITVTSGQLFYYLYNVAPSGAFFADVVGFYDLR